MILAGTRISWYKLWSAALDSAVALRFRLEDLPNTESISRNIVGQFSYYNPEPSNCMVCGKTFNIFS